MKKPMISSPKLQLSKKTISNLEIDCMREVKGGGSLSCCCPSHGTIQIVIDTKVMN